MNFSSPKTIYIIGVIIFFLLAFSLFFNAPNDFPVGSIINIKEGTSLRTVSKELERSNIISSRVLFETFVILFEGEKVVSGDYLFDNKIPVFEVARRMSRGDRRLAPIKVTIPEGFTISEISKTFTSKLPNFSQDNFLKEAKEGYLFPDTYFFLTTDTEVGVIKSMSDNFEKKILPIRPEIILSGKSEKDIIIMASIIEKESKGDVDRGFISGILWRRLSMGMPLQVDADMSTYRTEGLPKNPISNPGLKAIEAAIHPQNSSYLYYLHDKDGNIHYASTFAEHLLNKLRYLK